MFESTDKLIQDQLTRLWTWLCTQDRFPATRDELARATGWNVSQDHLDTFFAAAMTPEDIRRREQLRREEEWINAKVRGVSAEVLRLATECEVDLIVAELFHDMGFTVEGILAARAADDPSLLRGEAPEDPPEDPVDPDLIDLEAEAPDLDDLAGPSTEELADLAGLLI